MTSLKQKEQLALDWLDLPSAETSELLKHLDKSDFHLEEFELQSFNLLIGVEGGELRNNSVLKTLQLELVDFAQNYFLLAPSERRERFNDLNSKVEVFRELEPRLNSLRAGLSVDPASIPESSLVNFILEIYPLTMNERCEKFDQLLEQDDFCAERELGEFLSLKEKHPEFVELVPYLEELLSGKKEVYQEEGDSRFIGSLVFILWVLLILGILTIAGLFIYYKVIEEFQIVDIMPLEVINE